MSRVNAAVITENVSVKGFFVMATRNVLTVQMKLTVSASPISLNVRSRKNVSIKGVCVIIVTIAKMLATNRIAVSSKKIEILNKCPFKQVVSAGNDPRLWC